MKVVDADIFIDLSKQIRVAADYFNKHVDSAELRICMTTKFELLEGARNKKELNGIKNLFEHVDEVCPTHDSMTVALGLFSTYYLSHGIDVFDALLAGYALSVDATVVTRNRKHYDFIPGLKYEVPY